MPIDQNELLQALRNGALVDALSGLPIRPALCMSMEAGVVMFGRNEQAVYATEDDPSKLRGGALKGGFCISGNILTEDDQGSIIWARPGQPTLRFREREIVLLNLKQDERYRDLPRSDPRFNTGCLTLHLMHGPKEGTIEDPATGKLSDGMVKVLEIRWDGGEFLVPMAIPGLSTPAAAAPSVLRSPGDRYDMEMQTDGCVTCYDEAAGHVPMWQVRYVGGAWQFVSLNAPVTLP